MNDSELKGAGREIINEVSLISDSDRFVPLYEIVKALQERSYSYPKSIISYFSKTYNSFVHSGRFDFKEANSIPYIDVYPRLILKIRTSSGDPPAMPPTKDKTTKKEKSRRNKERKIGDIIEKVNEWRTLYTGIMDDKGKLVKYSLEDAANKVGIAKKTLDDYLLQLRAGKKYNFDFQTHKDSKVGVLRRFVKDQKNKEKSVQDQSESDQGIKLVKL